MRSHLEWWGLAGAFAQMLGVVLMLAGSFFRPGVLLVLIWVVVHTVVIWKSGGLAALVSLELCLVLVSLFFIGPGKYSVDKS